MASQPKSTSHASRSDIRLEGFESRVRLVSAIARGHQSLNDVVSGQVTTVTQLCTREKWSARHVNISISLAFLAPNLVKAAVEGRLPRGIGVERLRDPPTEMEPAVRSAGTQSGLISREDFNYGRSGPTARTPLPGAEFLDLETEGRNPLSSSAEADVDCLVGAPGLEPGTR
jgi:hypothetical protein